MEKRPARRTKKVVYRLKAKQPHSNVTSPTQRVVKLASPIAPGDRLSLQQLIHCVTEEAEHSNGNLNIETIGKLLDRYDHTCDDWKPYAFWDESRGYTRNLIATDNETWSLLLLCWNPQRFSPIHNHATSECFLKCVHGRFVERQYIVGKDSTEPLRLLTELCLNPGDSSRINDSIAVHSVGNDGDVPGATLHLYCPPYHIAKCYLDLNKSESMEARVTFFTENGKLLCEDGEKDGEYFRAAFLAASSGASNKTQEQEAEAEELSVTIPTSEPAPFPFPRSQPQLIIQTSLTSPSAPSPSAATISPSVALGSGTRSDLSSLPTLTSLSFTPPRDGRIRARSASAISSGSAVVPAPLHTPPLTRPPQRPL